MNAHRKIIKDNARSLLKIIAKQYNCNYSSALFQILKEHPNAPSFLSLQYILQQMGKESFAMHVTYEELQNLPRPFIAHITTNVDLFLFITNITPDNVQMIDVEGNIETIDRTDFDHMWDGNILLIDEKQGNIKISFKEKFNTFINQIRFPFFNSLHYFVVHLYTHFKTRTKHSILSISNRYFRRNIRIHTSLHRTNRQKQYSYKKIMFCIRK